jgi:hypothetical protein
VVTELLVESPRCTIFFAHFKPDPPASALDYMTLSGGTERRADSASSAWLTNEDVLKFRWIRAPVEVRVTHGLAAVPGDQVLPARLCETVQRQPLRRDRHFLDLQRADCKHTSLIHPSVGDAE